MTKYKVNIHEAAPHEQPVQSFRGQASIQMKNGSCTNTKMAEWIREKPIC